MIFNVKKYCARSCDMAKLNVNDKILTKTQEKGTDGYQIICA